jgi:predicted site-specific integrase-resolvase
MSDFVTAEEIARKLRLRPHTIQEWTRDGLIPAVRLNQRVVRYDPVAVEAAIRERSERLARGVTGG